MPALRWMTSARLDTRLGQAFAQRGARRRWPTAASTATQVTAIGSHGQTLRHDPRGAGALQPAVGRRECHRRSHRHHHRRRFPPPRRRRRRPGRAADAGLPCGRDALAGRRPRRPQPGRHRQPHAAAARGRRARLRHRPGQWPDGCLVPAPSRPALRSRRAPSRREGRVRRRRCWRGCWPNPWFALPPPKSTGRDQFQLAWLEAHMDGETIAPADVQATLCELSAATVADALQATLPGAPPSAGVRRRRAQPAADGAAGAPPARGGGGQHGCPSGWIRTSSKPPASPGWRGKRWRDDRATCPASPAPAGRGCWVRSTHG